MTAEKDIDVLLKRAAPYLVEGHFVYASFPGARYGDLASLKPLAVIREREGLTMVLDQQTASVAGLDTSAAFRLISLAVHSSLEAVGLTAFVSACLAERGIPANMLAGYYHDHVLVPAARAEQALQALQQLGSK